MLEHIPRWPYCFCITASAFALNLKLNAGPRVLEHIVDTVVYMEGGRQQPVRLVRVRAAQCWCTTVCSAFMRVPGPQVLRCLFVQLGGGSI